MQQLTPQELKEWMANNRPFKLIDVREVWEHELFNIGGQLIPLGELMTRKAEIPAEGDVVLYCEKGIRSGIAIQRLHALGYNNLFNLLGGMSAWRSAEGDK